MAHREWSAAEVANEAFVASSQKRHPAGACLAGAPNPVGTVSAKQMAIGGFLSLRASLMSEETFAYACIIGFSIPS